MQLFVKMADKTITLDVEETDSIFDVKAKLAEAEGIPADRMQLATTAGKQMKDEDRLQLADTTGCTLCLQSPMHIVIRTAVDKTVTLEVDATDRIRDVKLKLAEAEGIPPEEQQLIFEAQQLEDGNTVVEYNIQEKSELYLVPRVRRKRVGFQLFVQMGGTGGKLITLDVEPSDTIGNVKAQVEEHEGIPQDQQTLLYAGKEMMGPRTLNYYKIRRCAIMVLRLPPRIRCRHWGLREIRAQQLQLAHKRQQQRLARLQRTRSNSSTGRSGSTGSTDERGTEASPAQAATAGAEAEAEDEAEAEEEEEEEEEDEAEVEEEEEVEEDEEELADEERDRCFEVTSSNTDDSPRSLTTYKKRRRLS